MTTAVHVKFLGVAMRKRTPEYEKLTREEVEARMDRRAQALLNVDAKTAIEMLDKGALRGTVAEAQLRGLNFLVSK